MATIRHIKYTAWGQKRERFIASIMVTRPPAEIARTDGSRELVASKRVQERKIFATNEEANEWLAERQREIREGVATRPDPITLAEAVEKVVATQRADGVRTASETERLWKNQLIPYFGSKTRVTAITAEMIACYASDVLTKLHPRLQRAITISTVNRHKAAIRHLLRLCWEWGYVRAVPHVKMGREPEHGTRYLELDEVQRLLDACEASANPDLYDLVALALHTGMRRGELLGLMWPRVHFPRGVIVLDRTKNGHRREVPMDHDVDAILTERWKKAKNAEGPVFGNAQGHAWSEVKHSFATALKKAEIKDFRFHDLRHTAASWMVMKGATLPEVMKILGHRDLQMTLRYAHLSPNHLRSAVTRLDGLFPLRRQTPSEPSPRKARRVAAEDNAQPHFSRKLFESKGEAVSK